MTPCSIENISISPIWPQNPTVIDLESCDPKTLKLAQKCIKRYDTQFFEISKRFGKVKGKKLIGTPELKDKDEIRNEVQTLLIEVEKQLKTLENSFPTTKATKNEKLKLLSKLKLLREQCVKLINDISNDEVVF